MSSFWQLDLICSSQDSHLPRRSSPLFRRTFFPSSLPTGILSLPDRHRPSLLPNAPRAHSPANPSSTLATSSFVVLSSYCLTHSAANSQGHDDSLRGLASLYCPDQLASFFPPSRFSPLSSGTLSQPSIPDSRRHSTDFPNTSPKPSLNALSPQPQGTRTRLPPARSQTLSPTAMTIPSEQEKAKQNLVNGMRLLNISLPDNINKKLTTNYKGMTPMDRFMLETLKGDDASSGNANRAWNTPSGRRSVCVSCAPTLGDDTSGKEDSKGQ